MTDPAARKGASGEITAAGPSSSPWLRILGHCLPVTVAVVAAVAVAGGIVVGPSGAVSALCGAAMVIVFFATSLLIGHYVGRHDPSAALVVFVVAYVVKFLGLAVVLILLGSPQWLERLWFFVAALAAVLVWQVVEMIVFAKVRRLVFAPQEDSVG